jgi:signal transduction histidine kinase
MPANSQLPWLDYRATLGNGVRRVVLEYGVAVVAVAAAILLRWLFNPLLGHRLPLATLYGAVAVTVWFGGWRPALLATVVGFVAANRLLIKTEPDAALTWSGAVALAGLAVYLSSCLIIIGFGSGMRAAQRRAEASAQDALAHQNQLQREAVAREQAERALSEADRRKDEFLATLAHELANSLAPMGYALALMQKAADDQGAVEESRHTMERQLRQMTDLVDDLRDLARVKSGKVQLRTEQVDLTRVLGNAVEKSRPLIEASAHRFTLTLPPEPIYLDADATRLAQVFSNLLNNAAKYTEKGGSISLTAHRQNSEAIVSVRDTGIGIPAENLRNIFELFSQAAPALERSQGGLGIGLSLVRRLVELHGGCVDARSDGPGKGSEFTVRLPALNGATHTTRSC